MAQAQINVYIEWTDGSPRTWYLDVKNIEAVEDIKKSFEETEPGYLTEFVVTAEVVK